jgi:uncharacterized FlgJ-related protein
MKKTILNEIHEFKRLSGSLNEGFDKYTDLYADIIKLVTTSSEEMKKNPYYQKIVKFFKDLIPSNFSLPTQIGGDGNIILNPESTTSPISIKQKVNLSNSIDQDIVNVAMSNGWPQESALLIAAQCRLETADYTSCIFKCNNNLFGMKYVGQSLAKRGTLAPNSEVSKKCKPNKYVGSCDCERTGSGCSDSDHYARYNSVADSIKDAIERLFEKTRNGVTPEQLKNAKTPDEYADLQKQRGYFGASASAYASGLKSKLNKMA